MQTEQKKLKYKIIDSHRIMTKKTRDALTDFFREVKNLSEEEADRQVRFCDWFEREYAVKWYEILVCDMDVVVGYLRCLRNSGDPREWFIGDVHVRKSHQRRGIATGMYERVIDEVSRFETAECIISAVRRDNSKSVLLHEKMGFEKTLETYAEPDFYINENEDIYRKWICRILPVPADAVDIAGEKLMPLWMEGLKKKFPKIREKEAGEQLEELLEKAAGGQVCFDTIWCGNRLVGYRYTEKGENIVYNQLENDGK